MPTPVFPSDMPVVQRLTLTPDTNLLLDEGEGRVDFRRRSRVPGADGSIEWTFTRDELAIFNAFRKDDLLNDHKWFYVLLPSPAGITYNLVRFKSVSIQVTGHRSWTVSADIRIRARAFETFTPPISGGGGDEIGWFAPIDEITGVAAHTNSGTAQFHDFISEGITDLYAGVVGYTDQVVVWSSIWTPVGTENAPIVEDLGGGIVRVNWVNGASEFPSVFDPTVGTLILTASINGVPIAVGQRLVVSCNGLGDYPFGVWGPEP